MALNMKKDDDALNQAHLRHRLQKIYGGAVILLYMLTLLLTGGDYVAVAGFCYLLLYLLLTYLTARYSRITGGVADETETPALRSVTLELITRVYMPIVICDESGKIAWYNKAAATLFHSGEVLYGRYLDQYCTANITDINGADAVDGLSVGLLSHSHLHFHNQEQTVSVTGEHDYSVKAYPISADGRRFFVTFWNDKHEIAELKRRAEAADAVVCYITIDNLDELLQYMQDQYSMASAKAEAVLTAWVARMNGIIKEYERNKYLVVFEARYLPELIESRFSVMSEIHEIRVGDSSMPVTLSMGLSHITSDEPISFVKKEEAAKEALNLALQRGGDQAVYRSNDGYSYYGGRTKAVTKRTKVRSRVMAGELAVRMANASNILIMGHRYSDHDSIGSCIGIYRFAKQNGKRANIVISRSDPNAIICLERLHGISEYDSVFLDASEATEFITSETLLIICDVSNPYNFESPELYENVQNTVIIDHHRKTGEFKYRPVMTYIDPSASSASELVAEMLEEVLPAETLPIEEADLMLAGILLDTNQFTRNTGVRTFSAALYLRREGASPSDAKKLFRISLDDYVRESRFSDRVEIYRDVIAVAIHDSGETSSGDRIAAAKAADKLLSVQGVSASFTLVRIDGVIHISARSQGTVNVQLILERLHGGGHYDVAGAQLQGISMQSALEQLKDAIDAYARENGLGGQG